MAKMPQKRQNGDAVQRAPLDRIPQGAVIVLRHTHESHRVPYFLAVVAKSVDSKRVGWRSMQIAISWLENAKQKDTNGESNWHYVVDKNHFTIGTAPVAGMLLRQSENESSKPGTILIDAHEHAAILALVASNNPRKPKPTPPAKRVHIPAGPPQAGVGNHEPGSRVETPEGHQAIVISKGHGFYLLDLGNGQHIRKRGHELIPLPPIEDVSKKAKIKTEGKRKTEPKSKPKSEPRAEPKPVGRPPAAR
jgi:hypothetical protein